MAKKMLAVIVSLGLMLSACGKRKPDVLTGATEVPQIESSIQEEQDFITRVDVWIANHPCYTAVITGCVLVAYCVGCFYYDRRHHVAEGVDPANQGPFSV